MRSCQLDRCERPAIAQQAGGYCGMHYMRKRRGTPMNAPVRQPIKTCTVTNCNKTHRAKGYCSAHYWRAERGKSLDVPLRKRRLQDGEWSVPWLERGYYRVRVGGLGEGNSKCYFVHRLLMEQQLGRKLRRAETVHHINGDTTDNRPENLELWSKSHPCGQRVTDKVQWAKDWLSFYEPGALNGTST